MAGHGEKLSRKQEIAIAALLAERSVAEAAKKIGVGVRTLKSWTAQKPFAEALAVARRQLLAAAVLDMAASASAAVAALRDALTAEKVADRVRAADVLLGHLGRSADHELAERVEILEGLIVAWRGKYEAGE